MLRSLLLSTAFTPQIDYPIPEMATVMDFPDFIMALFFHRNTLSKAPKVPFQCTLPSRLSCSLAVAFLNTSSRYFSLYPPAIILLMYFSRTRATEVDQSSLLLVLSILLTSSDIWTLLLLPEEWADLSAITNFAVTVVHSCLVVQ